MGLSIKNPRTQQLARELAELTGETVTAAITEALEEKIDRIKREKSDLVERWDEITKETAQLWKDAHPTVEELLYDERGMPIGTEE
jgi:antitoxin VapB